VTGDRFPGAVHVVAHQVDLVQIEGHLGDVKGRVDGALAARNGSGQHETVRGEGRLEFTQQADEIFLCVKLME